MLAAVVGKQHDVVVEVHAIADIDAAVASAVPHSGWSECMEQWALGASINHQSLRRYFELERAPSLKSELASEAVDMTAQLHTVWTVLLVLVAWVQLMI